MWWILGTRCEKNEIIKIHEQIYVPFREKVGLSGLMVDDKTYFAD